MRSYHVIMRFCRFKLLRCVSERVETELEGERGRRKETTRDSCPSRAALRGDSDEHAQGEEHERVPFGHHQDVRGDDEPALTEFHDERRRRRAAEQQVEAEKQRDTAAPAHHFPVIMSPAVAAR